MRKHCVAITLNECVTHFSLLVSLPWFFLTRFTTRPFFVLAVYSLYTIILIIFDFFFNEFWTFHRFISLFSISIIIICAYFFFFFLLSSFVYLFCWQKLTTNKWKINLKEKTIITTRLLALLLFVIKGGCKILYFSVISFFLTFHYKICLIFFFNHK